MPIVKQITLAPRPVVLFFAGSLVAFLAMAGALSGAPQRREHVKPIPPPVTPLPPEEQSRDVAPSVERGLNPDHFVIVRVDGEKLDIEVFAVDVGSGLQPYRSNKVGLQYP